MNINFSDEKVVHGDKSIFLAGPTRRNSPFELSWRKNACEILEKLNYDGIVYVPEFKNGNNPMEFLNQTDWEREALFSSDIIIFYIPRKLPDMPGFTTNVEFGYFLALKKDSVMLCCPEGSEKNRYLEWLFHKDKPNDTIYRNLTEICFEAVKKLS